MDELQIIDTVACNNPANAAQIAADKRAGRYLIQRTTTGDVVVRLKTLRAANGWLTERGYTPRPQIGVWIKRA